MSRWSDRPGERRTSCRKPTRRPQAGALSKMFHLYSLNRDEFLGHYHKRSNIETTNMMIKSKFGELVAVEDRYRHGQ